jgi:hypothetical protein
MIFPLKMLVLKTQLGKSSAKILILSELCLEIEELRLFKETVPRDFKKLKKHILSDKMHPLEVLA